MQPLIGPVGMMKLRVATIHVMAAAALLFVPLTPTLLLLTVSMYLFMQLGYEAVCHRYFAHRSYKTSRGFQLLLALWGSATGQKGMLWWADTHRQHHRRTDQLDDAHSPMHHGLWHAHVAWLWHPAYLEAHPERVKDLRAYPEIVWLDAYWELLPNALMLSLLLVGGLPWMLWGGGMAMTLSMHATWATNSYTHFTERRSVGRHGLRVRRFDTADATNNAPWLSMFLVGANWHNNHHRYPAAARAGFYPGELDIAYGMLRLLEAVGLIWDLKGVPDAVLEEGREEPLA